MPVIYLFISHEYPVMFKSALDFYFVNTPAFIRLTDILETQEKSFKRAKVLRKEDVPLQWNNPPPQAFTHYNQTNELTAEMQPAHRWNVVKGYPCIIK